MHSTLSASASPCTPAATEGLRPDAAGVGVGVGVGLEVGVSPSDAVSICRPLSARHRKWWYRAWKRSLGAATFSTAPCIPPGFDVPNFQPLLMLVCWSHTSCLLTHCIVILYASLRCTPKPVHQLHANLLPAYAHTPTCSNLLQLTTTCFKLSLTCFPLLSSPIMPQQCYSRGRVCSAW